jgi:hypothetical protein
MSFGSCIGESGSYLTIRRMIAVQLSGGLGNQMFEYATARALAVRRGVELVLDSSWIAGRGGASSEEIRRYELGCYDLAARLVHIDEVARLPGTRAARLRRLLPGRRPFLQEIVEPPFGEPLPELVDAADNTYLRGYLQNPAYFADAEELLRKDFTFRPPVAERGAQLAEELRTATLPLVSLHVRRTGYVTDAGLRERLGALGFDYFRRAVDVIASRVGAVKLAVFTDDPDWCREHVRLDHETTIVGAARAEQERWDSIMSAMSRCDHYVIANSSFSWWGAWLNPSPAKIVVAPRPWYRAADKPDDHRTPPEWIRVDRDSYQADQPPSTTTFEPVT